MLACVWGLKANEKEYGSLARNSDRPRGYCRYIYSTWFCGWQTNYAPFRLNYGMSKFWGWVLNKCVLKPYTHAHKYMNVLLVFLDLPFGLCWAANCVTKAVKGMGTGCGCGRQTKSLLYAGGHLTKLRNRIGFALIEEYFPHLVLEVSRGLFWAWLCQLEAGSLWNELRTMKHKVSTRHCVFAFLT